MPPVDVVQREPDHIPGPQAVRGEQHEDGIVAPSARAAAVNSRQQAANLVPGNAARQRGQPVAVRQFPVHPSVPRPGFPRGSSSARTRAAGRTRSPGPKPNSGGRDRSRKRPAARARHRPTCTRSCRDRRRSAAGSRRTMPPWSVAGREARRHGLERERLSLPHPADVPGGGEPQHLADRPADRVFVGGGRSTRPASGVAPLQPTRDEPVDLLDGRHRIARPALLGEIGKLAQHGNASSDRRGGVTPLVQPLDILVNLRCQPAGASPLGRQPSDPVFF